MLETILRLKNDREIADACKQVDAVATPGEGPWHALFRDRQGRTLVRAAASNSTLLVDVAAPPSTLVAAAVLRGVLIARQGVTARPEDEVRQMSRAELAGLVEQVGRPRHEQRREEDHERGTDPTQVARGAHPRRRDGRVRAVHRRPGAVGITEILG